MSLHAKEDSGISAQRGGQVKRVEAYRGRDGVRGGEVSANKGIKERAGKGSRERETEKKRGETRRRKCMNGKNKEKGAFLSY